MKIFCFIIFLLISAVSFSQAIEKKFININNKEISEKQFNKQKHFKGNLDVVIRTDSLITGMLVKRKNKGKLNVEETKHLYQYLSQLTGKEIASTKTLVINYLSSTPKTPYYGEKSQWTLLNSDYLIRLNQIPNMHQIWINNPDNQNLEYFHNDRINWHEDTNRVVEKLFFPYEFEFGSFAVINSNGNYISYFTEYGKDDVLKTIKQCLKLK